MSLVLDKKLRKALELRTDTPQMMAALDSISEFWGPNTLEARRGLRQELEHQNVLLASSFLEAFEPVHQRVSRVQEVIGSLEESCETIQQRLRAAETAMMTFTEQAADLQQRREELDKHADEVEVFLNRYSLSTAESQALKDVDLNAALVAERIGQAGAADGFFQALARLHVVRQECNRLVGSKHQSAAFDLLEQLSQQQERAYAKVYEWVQVQCAGHEHKAVDDPMSTPSPDADESVDGVMQASVRALRARPSFYLHCQEAIASHRRGSMVKRFLAALTVGGPGGTPRPIELQAHDAVRYLGDMCAWTHQAVASERETLAALFGGAIRPVDDVLGQDADRQQHRGDGEPQQQEDGQGSGSDSPRISGEKTVPELLAQITRGLARPLSIRAQGVLQAQLKDGVAGGQAMVLTCQLHNLLTFYCGVVAHLFQPHPTTAAMHSAGAEADEEPSSEPAALVAVLHDCRRLAAEVFRQQLMLHGEALLRSPAAQPLDLSTPPATSEHLRRLTDVLQVQQQAMAPELEPKGPAEVACGPDLVLTSVLEPLLQSCRAAAEGLDQTDTAIFMINNATDMLNAVTPFQAAEEWVHKLKQEVDTWAGVLAKEEASKTVHESGLDALLQTAEVMRQHGPAAEQIGLDPDTVKRVMNAFYAQLFALAMPRFERLAPQSSQDDVRRRIGLQIARAHDDVCALVRDPANLYPQEDFADLLHDPQQVRMLLNC